jgi:RNA polymerase sporulation-specific sigma factor
MLSVLALLLVQGNFLSLRMNTSAGSFPRPLKPEEERELLQRAGGGDLEARNRLIEHNLRLVAHIVKKYYTQTGEVDDLISIGTIGLIKAVNTYQPDKKSKLATYAARCIENEILMYLRKTRRLSGEVSLSETLDTDGDGGNLSVLDLIRVEDDMLEELDTRDECRRVRRYVDQVLEERERQVIVSRYGLDGKPPRTQREVALQCGISRSYVSRIEKRALKKLEEAMAAGPVSS